MRSLLVLVSAAALVVSIYSRRPCHVAARHRLPADASFSPRYSRSYSMELIDFSHKTLLSVSARSSWCSNGLRHSWPIAQVAAQVECEIVPDRLSLESIFQRLDLDNSISCRDEMECSEREIGDLVCS
ncbi:U-box domain-containing protein 16-like protein [Carex littledalei]|uniref:U-box domain-containing protein 16-like protein n=1 Tax=Carex littledalei TaxID=544730 RepID=A0A833V8R2_9POAL|nr:U-box domain-containing protein 16-like protein [Carex littledalei]